MKSVELKNFLQFYIKLKQSNMKIVFYNSSINKNDLYNQISFFDIKNQTIYHFVRKDALDYLEPYPEMDTFKEILINDGFTVRDAYISTRYTELLLDGIKKEGLERLFSKTSYRIFL